MKSEQWISTCARGHFNVTRARPSKCEYGLESYFDTSGASWSSIRPCDEPLTSLKREWSEAVWWNPLTWGVRGGEVILLPPVSRTKPPLPIYRAEVHTRGSTDVLEPVWEYKAEARMRRVTEPDGWSFAIGRTFADPNPAQGSEKVVYDAGEVTKVVLTKIGERGA